MSDFDDGGKKMFLGFRKHPKNAKNKGVLGRPWWGEANLSNEKVDHG